MATGLTSAACLVLDTLVARQSQSSVYFMKALPNGVASGAAFPLAVKVVEKSPHNTSAADLEREHSVLAALRPTVSVPRVVGLVSEGTTAYLVSEFILGCPLNKLFYEFPRGLSSALVIDTLAQLALILEDQRMHCGLLHRDLKLTNILLTISGKVCLIDFGLAYLSPTTDSAPSVPRCRSPVGTRHIRAPEVPDPASRASLDASSDAEYGGACDVWSIGVCAVELLTGNFAFGPNTSGADIAANPEWFEAEKAAVLQRLKQLQVPGALVGLIEEMLVLDPGRRLGGATGDWKEVLAHPAFEDCNLDAARAICLAPAGHPATAHTDSVIPYQEEIEMQTLGYD